VLISVEELKRRFGVFPSGILHVGAHLAEEGTEYEGAGWSPLNRIIWIESQSTLVQQLSRVLDPSKHKIINATVWSEAGLIKTFHVANNSQSSSLFALGTHEQTYPEIEIDFDLSVRTSRLDEIIEDADDISFLNMDIEGAELEALKGLGQKIHKVKWIYSEVNKWEVYKGCARIEDLDEYLEEHSFIRIATRWTNGCGWGDALWIKKSERRALRKSILLFKANELSRYLTSFFQLKKHYLKSLIQSLFVRISRR